MPQITLNRADIEKLGALIEKHNLETWFLAKDDGAYVGAAGGDHEKGTFENCIFYFNGCNPKDEFCWEETRDKFGGDDFGERFDAKIIRDAVADPLVDKLVVNVTKSSVTIKTYAKKAPKVAPKAPKVAPKAPKAAPKIAPKGNKGERIRAMIADGASNESILAVVDTTLNSIRWHRSKMAK